MTNNASNAATAGAEWDVIKASWSIGTGVGTNLQGFGYKCLFPASGSKFGGANACFYIPQTTTNSSPGANDAMLRNEAQTSPGLGWQFAGPTYMTSITNDVGTAGFTINGATTVNGSITAAQIAASWGPFINGAYSGTAGASTYAYTFVAVDQNGGQSVSAATSNVTSAANPLDATHTITLTPSSTSLYGIVAQAIRLDVYRTSGPMATGKIGSITCKFNIQIYGCTAFVDNGLAVTTALPTSNTTGSVVAYAHGTKTNCAGVGTAASPSVATCTDASAGAFSCDVAASAATCTVNTTAVTANSEIFVTEVADEGTRLSVTCNTAPTVVPAITLSAKVAATSFTINMPTITTNPACFDYFIVN